MTKQISKFKFLFLLWVLSGCIEASEGVRPSGSPSDSDPGTTDLTSSNAEGPFVGNFVYEVIEGTDEIKVLGPTKVGGTGAIRINDKFERPSQDWNFRFQFKLTEADSSLSFFSFSNSELSEGIEIRASRLLGAGVLRVEVLSKDEEGADISEHFRRLDASGELDFSIDLHNNSKEIVSHMILWSPASLAKPLVNSRTDFDFPGRGRGVNWGFRLNRAELWGVQKGSPRAPHDH